MSVSPIQASERNSGRFRKGIANFNKAHLSGHFGKSLKAGTLDALGWNIDKLAGKAHNYGYLGWKKWEDDWKGISRNAAGKITDVSKVSGGWRGAARIGYRTVGRALPLMGTAYMAYSGYQEEGIWGAAKGLAESAAYSVAFHYIGGALGAAFGPLSIAAGIGVAGYMLGEAGIAHAKGIRQLEMGQQDQIQSAVSSAGAATMRQRSVMALNNTHINGRMALGNEGFLMHRSFV